MKKLFILAAIILIIGCFGVVCYGRTDYNVTMYKDLHKNYAIVHSGNVYGGGYKPESRFLGIVIDRTQGETLINLKGYDQGISEKGFSEIIMYKESSNTFEMLSGKIMYGNDRSSGDLILYNYKYSCRVLHRGNRYKSGTITDAIRIEVIDS